MSPDDGELVTQALLLAPLSLALWYGVAVWIRHLNAADVMADYRPSAAEVAATERAHLPENLL